MNVSKRCTLPAAILLLGTPLTVCAADDNTVVVTATRVARTADETLAPVTVITRQDIERSQAQTLEDVLRGQPGVSVANQGGPGKQSSVFLRGTNSSHVLVLVDGVKVGSATAGLTAFQDLPIEQIERIEIVRGPRSSLYGSEAIGGVIQIFTRKGGGATQPTLALGAGSRGTTQATAGLSGGIGTQGWYSLGLSQIDTDGINACRGTATAGCFVASEPDRDGYRNLSGQARLGWRFGNGLEAEVSWLRADGHNDYDGSFQNQSSTLQEVLGASVSMMLTPDWHSAVKTGRSLDRSRDFKDGAAVGYFNTERTSVSWQNNLQLAPHHLLVAGIDWQNDRVASDTVYDKTGRDNIGLFAQYLADLGRHSVELSARRDDNEQFGVKTTGAAAWGYALAGGTRLTASFGTAFKAPTFNDLYYPGFNNPLLKPERSRTTDLGISGTLDQGRWAVNIYDTKVRDLIGYDNGFNLVNISTAHIRGIELVGSKRVDKWDLRGNLGLTSPENDDTGKLLARRTEQAITLSADRDFGVWRAGATLRAEGRRFDNAANTVRLGGYATTDLHAEYRMNKQWRVQGRIENVFDRDYETVYLYNQPGRGAFVTLRYQP